MKKLILAFICLLSGSCSAVAAARPARKSRRSFLVLLVVIVALVFSTGVEVQATRIFVSPSGDDGNSGLTRQDPLATVQEAVARAAPGDEIRLLPGTYCDTYTGSPKSRIEGINGAPEKPIIIMSDSSDPNDFALVDGGVELVDGLDPNGTMVKNMDNYGFYIMDSSWLTLLNLKFRNCWAHVLYLLNSSYISVIGCDIVGGQRTILPISRSHHILVEDTYWEQDQRVWDTWDWEDLHHGSRRHYNGALLHPKISMGSLIMRGCTIRNVFNGYRTMAGAAANENGNVEIYNNTFINVRDNVFEPEAYAWNLHFYHNTIYNSHKSFSIDNVAGGPLYIYGNTQSQEQNPVLGPHYEGGPLDGITGIWKFKGPSTLTEACNAFNNSFYTHATAFKSAEATNHQMKHFNNAYEFFTSETRSGEFGLWDWDPSFEFDYDCLNIDPAGPWPNQLEANNQEQHGVKANILFEDGPGEDFRLQPTSPGIDAGKVISFPELGWTQSYDGNVPDIGAYEGDKLVEGPPFRYREPPGSDYYDEKPRIVRHNVDGNDLKLWFSSPLNPSTVSADAINIVVDNVLIPVSGVSLSDANYAMVVTTEGGLDEENVSLLLAPLPVGANGQVATYWASAIPIAMFAADLDGDLDVDFKDFAGFAEYWRESTCGGCGGADLAGNDGQVGLDDLREFVEHWLAGVK